MYFLLLVLALFSLGFCQPVVPRDTADVPVAFVAPSADDEQCVVSSPSACAALRTRLQKRVPVMCDDETTQQQCADALRNAMERLVPIDAEKERAPLMRQLQREIVSCGVANVEAADNCGLQQFKITSRLYTRIGNIPRERKFAAAEVTRTLRQLDDAVRRVCAESEKCKFEALAPCLKAERSIETRVCLLKSNFTFVRVIAEWSDLVVARALAFRRARLEEAVLRAVTPRCTNDACRRAALQLGDEAFELRRYALVEPLWFRYREAFRSWFRNGRNLMQTAWTIERTGNGTALLNFFKRTPVLFETVLRNRTELQISARAVNALEARFRHCESRFSRCFVSKQHASVQLTVFARAAAILLPALQRMYGMLSTPQLKLQLRKTAREIRACWFGCQALRLRSAVIAQILYNRYFTSLEGVMFMRGVVVEEAATRIFTSVAEDHLKTMVGFMNEAPAYFTWVVDPALLLPSIICMSVVLLAAVAILVASLVNAHSSISSGTASFFSASSQLPRSVWLFLHCFGMASTLAAALTVLEAL